MEKRYLITHDQLETIQHYQRMFELNAERINTLCSSEKDDVVYGFELGQIHSHLRDCFMEMMELETEIKLQHQHQLTQESARGETSWTEIWSDWLRAEKEHKTDVTFGQWLQENYNAPTKK